MECLLIATQNPVGYFCEIHKAGRLGIALASTRAPVLLCFMRRLGFTILLLAAVAGTITAQPAKKKPMKKPAAGTAAVSKATRPSAKPSTKTKAPVAHNGRSPVDDAGNKAAAAAASERVHAWMRDHHEVITDDAPPARPVRTKAASAATASAKATTKATGQQATTDDFLKAAEQRKALELKQEADKPTAAPAENEPATKPEPKAESPAQAPLSAATAAVRGLRAVPVASEEDERPAKSAIATKPTLNLAKPEAAKPSTQTVSLAKPVIEERAASELPAPPVLAVKRTELVEESTPTRIEQPKLTFRRGRLVVPAPLLGSHAILVRQNVVADRYGLERVQDDDDLERLRKAKQLVSLPDNKMINVDDRLAVNRRYARPWAVKFLNDLARAHYERFHASIQVNSAVRTVEFQQRLIRTNGNAAPAEGDTASPHLTGQAVDLAKHGLSMTEIAWMRAYLLPLVQEGKIDVEEEFQQACFHISIYKNYAPEPKGKPKSRLPKAALATALP